jgi:sulfite oxidase
MISRRRWLALAAAARAAMAQSEKPLVFPGKRPMLVHNDYPEDLETPVEYFTEWITPVDAFFVRQHLPRPKIDPAAFRLEVGGRVDKPLRLAIDDLRKLPQHTVVATLECAGNGRSYFRPRIPGMQWTKGAIGNAEWRGPRLREILTRAGAAAPAAWVDCDGADKGVAKTPDFIRSIPSRKSYHEATIVALEMNGAPLTDIHGAPARLVVPGWDGASWIKWLSKITVADQPDSGFYMNPAYRMPKHPVEPGAAPRPEDLEIIEGMAVKSFFVAPSENGAKLAMGAVELKGVAWGGENRIVRVEVSADGGATWRAAELGTEDRPFAWRLWRSEWRPARPGHHILCCRATDSAGRTQPIEAQWNPSGYLWNSIERLGVVVA